jgi:putative redox protein
MESTTITIAPQPPQGGPAESLAAALAEPLLNGPHVGEAVVNLQDPGGMAFRALPPSGHEVVIDTDAGHGGQSSGPEPLELLLVALAGCTGIDVMSIMRKKRQVVTDYRIRVAAEQRQEHPQIYTRSVVQHILSGPNLDPAAVARSVERSAYKYCPVSAMLGKACELTHQYRIVTTGL